MVFSSIVFSKITAKSRLLFSEWECVSEFLHYNIKCWCTFSVVFHPKFIAFNLTKCEQTLFARLFAFGIDIFILLSLFDFLRKIETIAFNWSSSSSFSSSYNKVIALIKVPKRYSTVHNRSLALKFHRYFFDILRQYKIRSIEKLSLYLFYLARSPIYFRFPLRVEHPGW